MVLHVTLSTYSNVPVFLCFWQIVCIHGCLYRRRRCYARPVTVLPEQSSLLHCSRSPGSASFALAWAGDSDISIVETQIMFQQGHLNHIPIR
ncbi:hypothetical protein HZ326_13996 [Fusarium oxysporum f. sp. albedinis]|nr:hypothetical protein HZ326_13996 [Fusarium oxysporum f. sp. albedinis]